MTRQLTLRVAGVLLVFGAHAVAGKALTVQSQGDAAAAADFGFRFALGVCGGQLILDTFDGTLTRTAPPNAITPLVVSVTEHARFSRMLDDLRFFSLPSQYVVVPPAGAVIIDVQPASTHTLRVRRDGKGHEVSWDTRRTSSPPDPVFAKLVELVNLVHEWVRPAVQKEMPPAAKSCA